MTTWKEQFVEWGGVLNFRDLVDDPVKGGTIRNARVSDIEKHVIEKLFRDIDIATGSEMISRDVAREELERVKKRLKDKWL